MVKSKRGEEYVEAAMVLPILILTILSMIFICIYYYESLANTADIHRKAIASTQEKNYAIKINSYEVETSKPITGIVNMEMSQKNKCRIYIINEANIIRGGKMVDVE